MRSLPFAIAVVVAGCPQQNAASRAIEANLVAAQSELKKQQAEVERLNAEVARLTAENARLRETEEGLWSRAVQAGEARDFVGARSLYQDFGRRFPASGRASMLPTALIKLDDQECMWLIGKMEAGLNLVADRRAVSGVVQLILDGPSLKAACRSKEGAARLRALRQTATETLAKWPVQMTVAEYTAKHADMKGKRALITGVLTQADYYNYGYRDRKTLRSFTLDDGRRLSAWCERRSPACEALFEELIGGREKEGRWVVENAARYYEDMWSGAGLLVLEAQP